MRPSNCPPLIRFVYPIALAACASLAIFFLLDISVVRAAPHTDRPTLARSAQRVQLAATSAVTLDVPILMYHHIGGKYVSPYNISIKDFAAQMDYLAQHGYTTVSIDQVAAALRGQTALPPCPVAITFDDGFKQQYTNALPILQQHNFKATFYLVTNYISMSYAFINWADLQALQRGGHWLGSHTAAHTAVGSLSGTELQRQIVAANTKLGNALNVSITTFSYPYGSFSLTAQRLISNSGFTSAVWLGATYRQSSDKIYKLNRIGVYSGSLTKFIAALPKHSPTGSGLCPAN